MLETWIAHSLDIAKRDAQLYSGCRKILRGDVLLLGDPFSSDRLELADAGYTKSKMTMLEKNYLHLESKAVAIELWEKRRGQAKYGSVGFTCYNHFVKGGSIDAKRSKRASVFGPCIQSVTLTWLSKTEVAVDVFYRTTELFKKFPADLVFIREVLLAGFNFDGMRVELSCHFANITAHPMYFVTLIPHLSNPIRELSSIKDHDSYFHDWLVKWTARYVCPEYARGIQKFAQAMRVAKDAEERIEPDVLEELRKYFRDNHPGYRGAYEDPDEDDG